MLQPIGMDIAEVGPAPTLLPENCQQVLPCFQELALKNQMILVGGAWWWKSWNKGISVSWHLDWGLEC